MTQIPSEDPDWRLLEKVVNHLYGYPGGDLKATSGRHVQYTPKAQFQLILTDQNGIDMALWKYDTCSLVTRRNAFSLEGSLA